MSRYEERVYGRCDGGHIGGVLEGERGGDGEDVVGGGVLEEGYVERGVFLDTVAAGFGRR